MDYHKKIAKFGLDIGAVKVRPTKPFNWVAGDIMPVYNDNRLFLEHPSYRRLFAECFAKIISDENIACDVIAGTANSGIPFSTTLADLLEKPLIYVRKNSKGHGMENQIEGIDSESDLLRDKNVILIKDLISTGETSMNAINAIRNKNGNCNYCFSIFDYEIPVSKNDFESLNPPCQVRSLLTYDQLFEVAKNSDYFNKQEIQLLEEWRKDPFNWSKKYNF